MQTTMKTRFLKQLFLLRKVKVVIKALLGIYLILSFITFAQPNNDQTTITTFIYPTAEPNQYNLKYPAWCLNEGDSYGETLTGYENYSPCYLNGSYTSLVNETWNHLLGEIEPDLKVRRYQSANGSKTVNPDFEAIPDLEKLATNYPNLESVLLLNQIVTQLNGLEKLSKLKYVALPTTYVEDWSILSELKHVETLNLACSNISNEDLVHVAKLKTLRTLILDGTDISDLSHLKDIEGLQNLLIKITNINNLEQLEVVKPLNLRWISFAPQLSKSALIKSFPDRRPISFIGAHTLERSNWIDNTYPSIICQETSRPRDRVW